MFNDNETQRDKLNFQW